MKMEKKRISISKPRNLKRKQVSKPSNSVPLIHNQVIETDPLVAQKIYDFLKSLPPGYRFKPTDEELILDYLRPKIANQPLPPCLIHPVNLYAFHPKSLAERLLKHPDGDEVYCFTPRDRKYKNGSRPRRGVDGVGYWKATGSDVKITVGDEVIGYVRTLTFYEGPPKSGKKTNWIMHEYRTCESRKRISSEDMKLDDWVLCKFREKAEAGPSKKEKKNDKEANANTNISDTDETGNVAVNDDNITDCDDCDEVGNSLLLNYFGTSYCNELDQSHQGVGLPWPNNLPHLFDTRGENFNLVNDNHTLGAIVDELSCIPGPSCADELLKDGADMYAQWERDLICNNALDCWPTCYEDSYDLQDSSCDLKIDDAEEEKDVKLEKRGD